MKWDISHNTLKSDFIKEVERISGQDIKSCYQCGKCSAGCPICFAMDYSPNQILRMIQLGMELIVLSSRSIWLCASCETCTTRCPQEVDLAEIMDALRRMAIKKKISSTEKDIPLFNDLFLENIRRYGRLYEMGIIGNYNMNSGHLFKDVLKAPMMFMKGKIGLLPKKTDVKAVKKIFKRAKRIAKSEKRKV